MNTLRSEAKRIRWTNGTGSDVSSGDIVQLPDMIGIACGDIANGASGQLEIVREHELPANAAEAWSQGIRLYVDASTSKLTAIASGNRYAGLAAADKAATATTALLLVNRGGDGGGQGVDYYANAAASAAHTDTTDEAAFDKSVSLDGANLQPGDIIHVRAQGIVTSSNSTDTLTVKLKCGTEVVVSSGAVDVADDDIFYIDAVVIVRVAGETGKIVGAGTVALGVEGTVTAKPFKLAEATEDLSDDVDITITADWSVAHADNSVRLDVLAVELLR